jgi:hypothetical protein
MEGTKAWGFKFNPESAEQTIHQKARELVNQMRVLLGGGDYDKGTKIWYDEDFHRLFYQLFDKKNPTIYNEVQGGFAFRCLEFLKQTKDRALIINENKRKKKKKRSKE